MTSHSFRLRCSRYDWRQKNRSAVYPNHNRQFHAQLIPFLVLFWSSYQLSQSKCQDDLKSLTIALEGSTGSVACCCDSRGKQSSYVCADNDACTSSAPLCWYVWILSAGASRNLWIRRYNLFITETNPFEPLTSNYECISRGRPRKICSSFFVNSWSGCFKITTGVCSQNRIFREEQLFSLTQHFAVA